MLLTRMLLFDRVGLMTMSDTCVDAPQVFKVERGARDWADETRGNPNDIRNIFKCMGIILGVLYVVMSAYTIFVPKPDSDVSGAVWAVVITGVFTVACLIVTFLILSKTSHLVAAAKKERKKRTKALNRSRKTAKKLGGAVVPVLTKEHVEAMARLEQALAGNGVSWSKSETDKVRALLLEDLDRAQSLVSLIESHEAPSLEQVLAELADMEAKPKPLQGGWL